MMFDPRSGFRPVMIFPAQAIGVVIVFLLIAALFAYLVVGAIAISVWFVALVLSPMLIFIPLGFALGWGFANRPAITAVALGITLAIVGAILWKIGVGAQFANAGSSHSIFRMYTLPLLAWSVVFFAGWLAIVTALHLRSRPVFASWWAITGVAIGCFIAAFIVVNPYSRPLYARYYGRELQQQRERAAADRICDKAALQTEIHDQRIYAICLADGRLPPRAGRVPHIDFWRRTRSHRTNLAESSQASANANARPTSPPSVRDARAAGATKPRRTTAGDIRIRGGLYRPRIPWIRREKPHLDFVKSAQKHIAPPLRKSEPNRGFGLLTLSSMLGRIFFDQAYSR